MEDGVCEKGRELCIAHSLAKLAVTNLMDRTWVEDFPECIRETVLLEQFFDYLMRSNLQWLRVVTKNLKVTDHSLR